MIAMPLWSDYQDVRADAPDALVLLKVLGAFCDTPFASTSTAIDTALDLIMRFVGVRTAFVTRVAGTNLDILDAHDNQGCGIPVGAVVPMDNSFCQYVRATDAPVVIPNAAQDARVQQVPAREAFSMGAYLGVPLHFKDGTLYGTLCALDPEAREFAPAHIEFTRLLGQFLASFIERDQLQHLLSHTEREVAEDIFTTLAVLDQQTTVVNIVAHDLRTPLTSMRGYLDLICDEMFGPVWPKQRDVLNRLRTNVCWMQRLINDIVDVAAMETQTFTLLASRYDPRHVAQQVVDLCQTQADDLGLELRLSGLPSLVQVVGDVDRVQQVLLHLVGNALRYTACGSVCLDVAMYEGVVEFRVIDTGPGIAAEDQEHIWERYTRFAQTHHGVGLGLYVVRQLVEAMHGTVGVESSVGHGSTFWVRLPLQGPAPHYVAWT